MRAWRVNPSKVISIRPTSSHEYALPSTTSTGTLPSVRSSHSMRPTSLCPDLVDDHAFPAQYASVKRFVGTLRGVTTPEARVVIETAVGEECQVDYGAGPMVRHPVTGKYRRTRLFVLTLGYSRKAVRLIVWKSSTRIWAELHERAFRHLGGAVKVVVLDNLREGVLKPDIYDPTLNPLYRDVLAHYGAVALPCRVRDPDSEGEGRIGCRPRTGDAAERATLRDA